MHDRYQLAVGPHRRPGGARCAMEWVAHLAGEEHTDTPTSVSPVLAAFARSRNDALDDAPRQRLRPYLARTIGSAGDGLDERRAWQCADWLVRTCVPALLEHAGLEDEALALWRSDPVRDERSARNAEPAVAAAARAASELRRARRAPAALDGARHATRALARAAGWEAARAATRTLPNEARDAIVDAACRAARDASWAAAWRYAPSPWQRAQPVAAALDRASFALLDELLPGEMLETAAGDAAGARRDAVAA
jgi:hypothetical protein